MAEYRKYMFDDFVVEEPQVDDSLTAVGDRTTDEYSATNVETETQFQKENISDETTESFEEVIGSEATGDSSIEETKEKVYSQEELDTVVKQACEEAYIKGVEETKEELSAKQVKLLENIESKLDLIFATIEKENSAREISSLKLALSAVRKIFPTLEKERAEEEIKNFLKENFSNFSSQEMLSFTVHSESISWIAKNLEKLAQQYDFEGKIAVHKDDTLGLSDCRVEWKNGGVERNATAILDKIENLTDNNEQERENGEQFES